MIVLLQGAMTTNGVLLLTGLTVPKTSSAAPAGLAAQADTVEASRFGGALRVRRSEATASGVIKTPRP